LVVKQSEEIKNLKDDNKKLIEATASFARVIQLLREAGLQTEETDAAIAAGMSELSPRTEEEDNEEEETDTHLTSWLYLSWAWTRSRNKIILWSLSLRLPMIRKVSLP